MLPLIISFISLALVRGDGHFNAPPLRQCEGALRPFQGTQRDDESAIGSTLAAIGGLVERVYVLCARRCERTPELAPSAWRHAFVVDGLRYDRCARLDGATRQQSRATLTHLAVLQDARESLALNATVLVLEDDAVATAAPPWSRARLEEFDATVLRAAGWLSVRLGWGFGGERAPGTTWSRDDGRGCACACDVSQRPWCALGRDCLVWSSVAYLASAGRTFDAWAAIEDAPPNFIVVGHIDRVAAAFSKVVVVPALAKQSGDAPGAWLAAPNTTCASERPTTAGSTANNATASDAALARLAALRAAGSLSAAEFARAAAMIHGNNRRPRRRLANADAAFRDGVRLARRYATLDKTAEAARLGQLTGASAFRGLGKDVQGHLRVANARVRTARGVAARDVVYVRNQKAASTWFMHNFGAVAGGAATWHWAPFALAPEDYDDVYRGSLGNDTLLRCNPGSFGVTFVRDPIAAWLSGVLQMLCSAGAHRQPPVRRSADWRRALARNDSAWLLDAFLEDVEGGGGTSLLEWNFHTWPQAFKIDTLRRAGCELGFVGRVETLNASLAALFPDSGARPPAHTQWSTDESCKATFNAALRAALVPGRLRRVCRLLAVDFDTFEYPLPAACAPARPTAGRTLGPTPGLRSHRRDSCAGGALNESAVTYPPFESAAPAPASGEDRYFTVVGECGAGRNETWLFARVPRRRGDPKLFATVLSRSTDGGATFRAPTELAAVRGSMSHNLAVLAIGGAAAEPVLLLIGGRTGFPPGANYSAEPAPLRPGRPPAGGGAADVPRGVYVATLSRSTGRVLAPPRPLLNGSHAGCYEHRGALPPCGARSGFRPCRACYWSGAPAGPPPCEMDGRLSIVAFRGAFLLFTRMNYGAGYRHVQVARSPDLRRWGPFEPVELDGFASPLDRCLRGGAVALESGGGSRAIDSIYFLSAAPNPADAGASLVALMPATSLDGAAGRILLAFSRDGVRWRGLRTLAHTESEGATGRTVDQNAAGVLTLRAVASFYVQRNVPGIGGDGATALKRIDIPLSLLECWTRSALGGSEGRTSPTTAEFARVPPRA